MKKVISILLCIILSVSFVGCNNAEETEKKNHEVKTTLLKVLKNEENFTYYCPVLDNVNIKNMEKFIFTSSGNVDRQFIPWGYMFVDFDSDKIDELLILDVSLNYYLILRSEKDKVYGYITQNINPSYVKNDGTFLSKRYINDGDKVNVTEEINTYSFKGDRFELKNLASKDDSKNTYKIEGKIVSKEKYDKYFEAWNDDSSKLRFEVIS